MARRFVATTESIQRANASKRARWERLASDLDAWREVLVYEAHVREAVRSGRSWHDVEPSLLDIAGRFGVTWGYIKRFHKHVRRADSHMRHVIDAVADPVIEGPVMAAFTNQVIAMEALADALERGDPPSVWRHHADAASRHAEDGVALLELVQGHSTLMLSAGSLAHFPRDPTAVALLALYRRFKAVEARLLAREQWADGWGGDGGEPLPV
jgi:hypothetical protein